MGVFISINGWSKHVVELTKQNPDKKVFLVNGDDIRAVLARAIAFDEIIRAKVRALTVKGEPFIGANDILLEQCPKSSE